VREKDYWNDGFFERVKGSCGGIWGFFKTEFQNFTKFTE
jgi:hypothetical protein